MEARTTGDILERIHQDSRCIDGLILPKPGKTTQQFKSRSELFIGPGHHDTMGEIYDVRSAVEHLHENRYLETFDRQLRLELLKKEAIIEYIARTALAQIVVNSSLWPHFSNTPALGTSGLCRTPSGGEFGGVALILWLQLKTSILNIFVMAIWGPELLVTSGGITGGW